MRVWIPRALALLALMGAIVGVVLVFGSVESTDEMTVGEAQDAMTLLNRANATLSGQLEALEPGDSPRAAQEAVRTAAEVSRDLIERVPGEGNLADRLREVIGIELEYLDAIGSTLNNPRSPLRGTIMQKGIALREVLQNIPSGDSGVVSGGQELVAYSQSRTGET